MYNLSAIVIDHAKMGYGKGINGAVILIYFR